MRTLTTLPLALLLCLSATAAHGEKSRVERLGDAGLVLLPLSAYSATLYLDDQQGRQQFYASFLANLGVTYALKFSVGRERPDRSDNQSFPSGHTSTAFQSAAFIQQRYGWRYALPAYALASYVGWSRIEADKHFTSDVIAGAAIGLTSSYLLTTPYPGITLTPMAGGESYGLTMNLHW